MLDKLIIKNIALIGYSEIEFGRGLNVLSGETGSGKSVILDSINFVLGAKADRSMIRYGENECSVSAVFRLENASPVYGILQELDIDPDEEVVITRKFTSDGRNSIKVNGSTVNVSMLRKITSNLVDVHGQSEHFYLLSEANQLALIDKAAKDSLFPVKEKLKALLGESHSIRQKLSSLGGDEAARGRRIDILKFQIDEIDRAELKEGEEEELKAKKLLFNNMEKIIRAASEALQFLGGEGGASDSLNGAKYALSEIHSFSPDYAALLERLENVVAETEDIHDSLSALTENLSWNEEESNLIEERLDLIRSLKKKYGETVDKIYDYLDSVREEYDLLTHCDEEFSKLSLQLKKNLSKIYDTCTELTRLRKQTGEAFCKRVEQDLKTLNIKNARFCAEFAPYTAEEAKSAGADGLDKMSFLFSANAGEPLKPLNKVISGGEMSRLMLAIKTNMSDVNQISTYIFDEIDTGISGNTARVVAEKFADIAKYTQIIAVSHLPQIAAMADENFLISKHETQDGKTVTEILPLGKEGRLNEIVRLVGGDAASNAAVSLASELIASCSDYKKSIKTIH